MNITLMASVSGQRACELGRSVVKYFRQKVQKII